MSFLGNDMVLTIGLPLVAFCLFDPLAGDAVGETKVQRVPEGFTGIYECALARLAEMAGRIESQC